MHFELSSVSYESQSSPAHCKRQLLWQRLRTVLIKEDGGKTSSRGTTSELILRMVEQNLTEVNLDVRREAWLIQSVHFCTLCLWVFNKAF